MYGAFDDSFVSLPPELFDDPALMIGGEICA
jgi:hypothetical protein